MREQPFDQRRLPGMVQADDGNVPTAGNLHLASLPSVRGHSQRVPFVLPEWPWLRPLAYANLNHMLRSLLRLSGAVAFAALMTPGVPSAATGPGLAYDEIVRVLVNATPPPPGGFQSDLAAASSTPVPAATPAPRRGINLGSLPNISNILTSGNVGNAAANAAANSALTIAGNALQDALTASLGSTFNGLAAQLGSFLQPHHMRYAYLNGWERVDDLTMQTATIRKCDVGRVVTLDLAKKTYTAYDPSAEPTPAPAVAHPAPRRAGPATPSTPEPPGTGVAQFTLATTALGPKPIEGQNTTGYDTSTTFAMTQATGSCHNGGATIRTTEYVAPIPVPSVNSCPVKRSAPVPETAQEIVAPPLPPSGGCRPTF
ncbi:MAG: hypothetical protein JO199_06030, partial [Candidatus Eremiobacteraeota bacterium]|nr:hypothetical protein [Candidatus Eremiobacteraeota bacterium]